jgi:hypothetical protein
MACYYANPVAVASNQFRFEAAPEPFALATPSLAHFAARFRCVIGPKAFVKRGVRRPCQHRLSTPIIRRHALRLT